MSTEFNRIKYTSFVNIIQAIEWILKHSIRKLLKLVSSKLTGFKTRVFRDLASCASNLAWVSERNTFLWEFDPGSGWTLAACLTHASRTKHLRQITSVWSLLWLSGGRVSNAWVTCLIQGDSSWKRLVIPHKRTVSHDTVWKTPVVWDGPASD